MNRGPAVPTAVQGGGALAGSGIPSAGGQWDPQGTYIRVIVGEPLPRARPQKAPAGAASPAAGLFYSLL